MTSFVEALPLSDFERYLTVHRGWTSNEARSLSTDPSRHEEYVELFAAWEAFVATTLEEIVAE